MGKKHKHEEHENLERWLVSYADFITLLFATFVVLYALSQIDLAKFKDMKLAMNDAFAPSFFKGKGSQSAMLDKAGTQILNENKKGDNVNILPQINPNLEVAKMEGAQKEIEESLKEANVEGVSAKVDSRGLVITLLDGVLFNPASAIIRPEAIETLNKLAVILKRDFSENKIRIEGHTDSDAISSSIYPSNWELSSARACSVVRYLISSFKMKKELFSAIGYADSIPIASNGSIVGKEKNRRVEIVITNDTLTGEKSIAGKASSTLKQSEFKNEKKSDDGITIKKGSSQNPITFDSNKSKQSPSKKEKEPEIKVHTIQPGDTTSTNHIFEVKEVDLSKKNADKH